MRTIRLATVAAMAFFAALSLSPVKANAETFTIEMLNFHRDDPSKVMVFDPEVLRIQPGDTVIFKSVDQFHNTKSIDGMIPEGATPWESELSADFEITFTEEGTYGFICTPHGAIGMVGLILVGDHTKNLDAAKAVEHAMSPVQDKFNTLFAGL